MQKTLKILRYYLPNLISLGRYLNFSRVIKKNNSFDHEYYRKTNPDVEKAKLSYLWHFYEYGWKEGRNPNSKFNTKFYLSSYPDVKKSGINPLLHYLLWGEKENRTINNKGEEIELKIIENTSQNREIDIRNIKTLRNGGIFDEEYYLASNPDVKDSGQDAATHFYFLGYKEGRPPCPNFNWKYYSK